jgi:hypothetical protein
MGLEEIDCLIECIRIPLSASFILISMSAYLAQGPRHYKSILDSHRRDPGSIPCNVTFCPNLAIVTQEVLEPLRHTQVRARLLGMRGEAYKV